MLSSKPRTCQEMYTYISTDMNVCHMMFTHNNLEDNIILESVMFREKINILG